MINLILPQTCTITRLEEDWSSGSPEYTPQVIAENVPCFYVRRDYESFHADAAPTKSRSTGVFYGDLDCPVQGQDTVTIEGIGSFSILPDGGIQTDYLGEPSHVEWPAHESGKVA